MKHLFCNWLLDCKKTWLTWSNTLILKVKIIGDWEQNTVKPVRGLMQVQLAWNSLDHSCFAFHHHLDILGGLLYLRIIDIFGQIILCCGGLTCRSMTWHCRMFSSIPGLCPLDTNRTPFPSCANQKHLLVFSNISCGIGGRPPLIDNSCSKWWLIDTRKWFSWVMHMLRFHLNNFSFLPTLFREQIYLLQIVC